ncbi:hypothetical protein B0W47_16755 (plasmid) [Komagataeibacter nataicola]|uniref:Uncharacterized protein n=2 Tax=Komagataeibacter nataicola TaxID=265960 RepID=A0A9N7CX75_9PROT|nr:hypothetical protein B0W47_16755 [Komagataeibacter nataicola]
MSEYSNHKLDNYDMLKWYKHIEHENDLLEAMSRGETKDKGIHIEGLTTSNGIPIQSVDEFRAYLSPYFNHIQASYDGNISGIITKAPYINKHPAKPGTENKMDEAVAEAPAVYVAGNSIPQDDNPNHLQGFEFKSNQMSHIRFVVLLNQDGKEGLAISKTKGGN